MKFIKNLTFILCCVCLLFAFAACNGKKTESEVSSENTEADSEENKSVSEEEVGYAFGVIIAQSVKQDGIKINPDHIVKGFKDAMSKDFEEKGLQDAQMILSQAFQIAQMEKAAKNLEEANAFLEKNKAKEGIIVTESGLQYEVLSKGKNDVHPKEDDEVNVNYIGKLVDGHIFDDSYKTGKSVKIHLSRVIPGWKEGLQLMSPGAKYRFYVPPALAYGEQGVVQGSSVIIPGNAVLIFDIELVSIAIRKESPKK
ncbi:MULTISPECIES: FKBP-type peptidyl-prolyl cis-trans isomerase [unclassified Treponema]|uniref:FKBP-type peptidyl-prolyl cis-trans isomerase n=1 Tax=unclassified Treponema TaxID=2638727 RepID=UPI0020A4C984|nr:MULTISPECIES: FKBP-type peptidyl-prolyl cis-trans isomerase [unclassified Treponema]UTC66065.1 FKBP-type peptidyl-prolyl cis-trans isomerase [Treponema sp. OMZ 789]UTC68795.1 FKBP-type peptidyl-prolyl cis-trans isomerase [Treponema sp. OMZ 790]UTC71523.1 FKBP-type peptidyl-prolyl cis-trans isomerase [Treponema sp. OMZ 791]